VLTDLAVKRLWRAEARHDGLSAGNCQPWALIVARRGTSDYFGLLSHLAGSSSTWAPSARLLVANLSHRFVEDADWELSEFSVHDLGEAVAHMSIYAQALGRHVRHSRRSIVTGSPHGIRGP
jgi:hypothetical protein